MNRGAAAKRAAILVLLVAIALLTARHFGLLQSPTQLADRIRRLRDVRGLPLFFLAIYVAATALAIPGAVLTLAGGALFGFGLGSLLNWLGATGGAIAAYFLARALGREALRTLLGRRAEGFEKLAQAHGLAAMFRLRLLPVIPFNALNFGAGFAGLGARDYILATAVGIIPGTLVYTYFADALLAGASSARHDAFVRVALASALLMLLSFLPAIARRLGVIAAATVVLSVGHTLSTTSAARACCLVDHRPTLRLLAFPLTSADIGPPLAAPEPPPMR